MITTDQRTERLRQLAAWHREHDIFSRGNDTREVRAARAAYAEDLARSLGWYLDVQPCELQSGPGQTEFVADLIDEKGDILQSEGELYFQRNEPRRDPFRRVLFAAMAEEELKDRGLWNDEQARPL